MTTISKAGLKRLKDQESRMRSLLSMKLISFKNDYLGDYVNWNWSKIENSIIEKELLINDPSRIRLINEERQAQTRSRWFHKLTVSELEGQVKTLKKNYNYVNLKNHGWLTEAMEGYNNKFDNLISKLMQYDFSMSYMTVERVEDAGGKGLAFLIKNDQNTIHARMIYANGAIKAPHYRFIITQKKN
tara:strand:- start:159 stop:719 length:561 start_codon:yes stop_codon:yes gene_type:complete